jgi:hypothetical protein
MFAIASTTLSVVVSMVLMSILVTTIPQNHSVYSVLAQVNNNSNNNNTNATSMNFAMDQLARLHLRIADEELMKGNTTAAFSQMNLAYLQFAMLGMKDMGITLNQTQAMRFMQGGGGEAEKSSSTIMVPENCIIIRGGVLECHDPLTGSYSLAK